jgi:hypothetical protein
MADQTKLSPTACAAVFQLGHEALPTTWRLIAPRLSGAGNCGDEEICLRASTRNAVARDGTSPQGDSDDLTITTYARGSTVRIVRRMVNKDSIMAAFRRRACSYEVLAVQRSANCRKNNLDVYISTDLAQACAQDPCPTFIRKWLDRAPTCLVADRRKTKPSDREARARLGDHDPPTPRDKAERSARALGQARDRDQLHSRLWPL